ncbi:Protein of unknown function [Cotesia congregata]|uniref:Uncharacterized protein n=1 Tax=Cotesia congregata TaxID=51543 RepID=A0A8J2HEP7_COTCN|nr:Protein of unknown function [Cotesia congregata]
MLQPVNHSNVDIGKLDLRRHLWSSKLTTDPAKRGETRNTTCAHVFFLPRFDLPRADTFFYSEEFVDFYYKEYFGILAFEI